jgi:hypothetical protein
MPQRALVAGTPDLGPTMNQRYGAGEERREQGGEVGLSWALQ